MFKKILIANRGEIAVRIQRACRELGIKTVAVFSDADRQAMHVRYADEAYYLGPSPSRESYLRGDKLIDIARKSGAEAIHPGYGFLAERADFAAACAEAGLVFIGPKPSSIAAMGDKATARATVAKAGVTIVPGTEGQGNLRDEELLTLAPKIGFPLLIKATAGGGGKGMREVNSLEEMPELLQSARREAEASFGDGNVSWKNSLKAHTTSNSRFSPISGAMSSTSANANAPSSDVTRNSLKNPPLPFSATTRRFAAGWARSPCKLPARWTTSILAQLNSW